MPIIKPNFVHFSCFLNNSRKINTSFSKSFLWVLDYIFIYISRDATCSGTWIWYEEGWRTNPTFAYCYRKLIRGHPGLTSSSNEINSTYAFVTNALRSDLDLTQVFLEHKLMINFLPLSSLLIPGVERNEDSCLSGDRNRGRTGSTSKPRWQTVPSILNSSCEEKCTVTHD